MIVSMGAWTLFWDLLPVFLLVQPLQNSRSGLVLPTTVKYTKDMKLERIRLVLVVLCARCLEMHVKNLVFFFLIHNRVRWLSRLKLNTLFYKSSFTFSKWLTGCISLTCYMGHFIISTSILYLDACIKEREKLMSMYRLGYSLGIPCVL
jgi:hypothetical protein